ncbi:hypothetical protein J6590_090930 [Homalodisca vitripennis]|nr:hypothetical protein J6590_090930 [Homalodisca vitripennis]
MRKLRKQSHEANSRSILTKQAHEVSSQSKLTKQSHEAVSRSKITKQDHEASSRSSLTKQTHRTGRPACTLRSAVRTVTAGDWSPLGGTYLTAISATLAFKVPTQQCRVRLAILACVCQHTLPPLSREQGSIPHEWARLWMHRLLATSCRHNIGRAEHRGLTQTRLFGVQKTQRSSKKIKNVFVFNVSKHFVDKSGENLGPRSSYVTRDVICTLSLLDLPWLRHILTKQAHETVTQSKLMKQAHEASLRSSLTKQVLEAVSRSKLTKQSH